MGVWEALRSAIFGLFTVAAVVLCAAPSASALSVERSGNNVTVRDGRVSTRLWISWYLDEPRHYVEVSSWRPIQSDSCLHNTVWPPGSYRHEARCQFTPKTEGEIDVALGGGGDFLTAFGVGSLTTNVVFGKGSDRLLYLGGIGIAHGGPGDDVFQSDDQGGAGVLRGGSGDDRLYGAEDGASDDWLYGGLGSDLLVGRKGDDLLVGGPGQDRCRGGPGHNRLRSCP